MQRFDTRLLIGVGDSVCGQLFYELDHDDSRCTGIDQLWSQLVRAMGQPLIFVPLSSIATADIEKNRLLRLRFIQHNA